VYEVPVQFADANPVPVPVPVPVSVLAANPAPVEQILKHRKRGRGYKYLIKWVSYLITEALWEPKSNLTGATDILQEYQELHCYEHYFSSFLLLRHMLALCLLFYLSKHEFTCKST
jgi:Chromo (CHRromatin Organisation MOdifier) domain